jgi:acyl-CoA reductase-like NAD-dependent aldehyde dehydrogenase
LGDADFSRAIPTSISACHLNSGQTCSALTRVLVPASGHDEAVAIAKATTEALTVGDPFDVATRLGPAYLTWAPLANTTFSSSSSPSPSPA